MGILSDAIKINIRPRELNREFSKSSPRDAFWAIYQKKKDYSERSINFFESELIRKFGGHLHNNLVGKISQGIADAEKVIYGIELREMLHEYRHFFPEFWFHKEKGWPPFYPLDPLSKLVELRQQVFKEVPAARAVFERLVVTSDITFIVRIDGYSSLNLSLFISQIEKLVQVFDADFESFHMFLDVFVPKSFGEVFDSDIANEMSFNIDIPPSISNVFARIPIIPSTTTEMEKSITPGKAPIKSEATQRAEWVWKIANGSLLIPVLLALVIMYFGFKEIRSVRMLQYEAIKPILEHQLQLLKEDRERLYLNVTNLKNVDRESKNNQNNTENPTSNSISESESDSAYKKKSQ